VTTRPQNHRDAQAADDGDGQRLQHLRAGAQGEGQRQHSADRGNGRHDDGPQPSLGRAQHSFSRGGALGAELLVGVEQQNAILGHNADDHNEAMNEATLNVVPVTSSARITPEMESTEELRMAMGAGKLRNSASSTPKTSASASSSTRRRSVEGLLLFLVSAAVLDAHRCGQMQAFDGLADSGHGAAQVGPFQAAGNHHQPLQVFAPDLVLRRQLLDRGQRTQGCRVA